MKSKFYSAIVLAALLAFPFEQAEAAKLLVNASGVLVEDLFVVAEKDGKPVLTIHMKKQTHKKEEKIQDGVLDNSKKQWRFYLTNKNKEWEIHGDVRTLDGASVVHCYIRQDDIITLGNGTYKFTYALSGFGKP